MAGASGRHRGSGVPPLLRGRKLGAWEGSGRVAEITADEKRESGSNVQDYPLATRSADPTGAPSHPEVLHVEQDQ